MLKTHRGPRDVDKSVKSVNINNIPVISNNLAAL